MRKSGAPPLSVVPPMKRPSSSAEEGSTDAHNELAMVSEFPFRSRVSRRVNDLDWTIYMARAQSGDKDAYRRLLDDITPYLRNLVARRFYVSDDVEDAVQEILLCVHAMRYTYDPTRPFGPWLVAIANRRIVDSMRRLGRARSREESFGEEHEEFAAPETDKHDGLSDGRALRRAVEQLPQAQREAVRMLKLEEMSLNEASVACGTSVVALKVSMHRAMQSLRKIITKESL